MSPAGTSQPQGTATAREPWLGLTPYSERDSELFYGRTKEAGELLRLVKRSVLTVLFGSSGTGKTSLLNAGLFPLLRGENYLPIAIRLDHSPASPSHIRSIRGLIAEALQKAGVEETPLCESLAPPGEETLWEYLHRVEFWDKRNNLVTPVLVFDQFEEAFTLGLDREETREFFRELADLVENYVPASVHVRLEQGNAKFGFKLEEHHYKVLLSLREDFVYRLDGLRKSMPSVMFDRFRLERMNGGHALEAVLKPGQGIVDIPAARSIVRFVAAARDFGVGDTSADFNALSVEPALLSVVCRELNTRRIAKGRTVISAEDVEAGEANILTDFYTHSFDGLAPAARAFVEDRLLTASGYRSTVPVEDALNFGLTLADVNALIDKRLIRQEERLGIAHLELTHDVLTKVVQQSRDARRETEQREKERRQRTEIERQRRRKLRQARRLTVMSLALTAVFLVLAVGAVLMWSKAREAKAKTEQALSTLMDLGDAFEDQLQPALFDDLATDLEKFQNDIPLVKGRVLLFRGLTQMARAREKSQVQDEKSAARAAAAAALDNFNQYAAFAEGQLDAHPADADVWTMELGKALQAAGDAEMLQGKTSDPSNALERYTLARKQFEALAPKLMGEDATDAALNLAGLYVRMLDAKVQLKAMDEARDLSDATEKILNDRFKGLVAESCDPTGTQPSDPHTDYMLCKIKSKLFQFRSSLGLKGREWAANFVETWKGPATVRLQPLFADAVDPYFGQKGDWLFIQKDKEYFFRTHPKIEYSLVDGTLHETDAPDNTTATLEFDYDYCVVSADGTPHGGRSRMKMDLSLIRSQWKITGIREQPSPDPSAMDCLPAPPPATQPPDLRK